MLKGRAQSLVVLYFFLPIVVLVLHAFSSWNIYTQYHILLKILPSYKVYLECTFLECSLLIGDLCQLNGFRSLLLLFPAIGKSTTQAPCIKAGALGTAVYDPYIIDPSCAYFLKTSWEQLSLTVLLLVDIPARATELTDWIMAAQRCVVVSLIKEVANDFPLGKPPARLDGRLYKDSICSLSPLLKKGAKKCCPELLLPLSSSSSYSLSRRSQSHHQGPSGTEYATAAGVLSLI